MRTIYTKASGSMGRYDVKNTALDSGAVAESKPTWFLQDKFVTRPTRSSQSPESEGKS